MMKWKHATEIRTIDGPMDGEKTRALIESWRRWASATSTKDYLCDVEVEAYSGGSILWSDEWRTKGIGSDETIVVTLFHNAKLNDVRWKRIGLMS